MFKIIIFLSIVTYQTNVFGSTLALELVELLFPKEVLTESFLIGFNKRKTDDQLKYYEANKQQITKIVEKSLSEPVVRDVAHDISITLSDAQISEVITFFKSPSGIKAKQLLISKKILKTVTSEERSDFKKFDLTVSGRIFGTSLPSFIGVMKKSIVKYSKPTTDKIIEYYKTPGAKPNVTI